MSLNQRQTELVEFVHNNGFVNIDTLVQHFDVTPQTIRRDLNKLAENGNIIRHHGGAEAASSSANTSYQSRKIMNLDAKEKIAKQVASMIPNGASVFINIGTTTETIAKALLNHSNLNIVTNNIHVATILSAKEDFTVIIAAGEVRHKDGGIIGEATCDFISQFHMDFGIIGISGISNDGSLLDFDFREVKVAQAIIQNSTTVILATDHSKFGRNAMVKQGNISQIDHFFTDEVPPGDLNEILETNNVQTYVV
ncbi:DeoR/GlpR family transcriptional regulator [Pseudocolwellia sp. AS88]|uniref:DeoR/GlpR family transcriptional regulator n=1 Tax=Pseudocolwellia sp. AS88 TaxID=3063958 RepID=UPI0026EEEF66|nr:DeoR/GlpR family transcriptional regulator [Pseudocolwellia sp. AS88]MDO7084929.1 DeoR/GlpR family transcriptional regulator [Pseudocolwellia sp. AS88]